MKIRRTLTSRVVAALLAPVAAGAAWADEPAGAPSAATAPSTPEALPEVQVSAEQLDRARNDLSPETGSSVYRFSRDDIQALPQGSNTPLNQVLLQAPGVTNDSYGQLHVRGDHADLQYRINGVIIPEAIGGFGQSLNTHLIDQANLITGALPAQYGYRTAGIVDIRTKSGNTGNGGSLDIYGGSHGTFQTTADVYGSKDALSYYFTATGGVNGLGIEAPTSDGSPLHDHTRQGNAFGYLSYIINPLTRITFMGGVSNNQFQIPNTPGLDPSFSLAGASAIDSANLNEKQSELNQFGVLALQGTDGGKLDYQVALFSRYTRTNFTPDVAGDLVFNGVASSVFHNNTAGGIQADATYRLNELHTLRTGVMVQRERASFDNSVSVFSADADGNQLSDTPFTINDSSSKTGYLYGLYMQDEWSLTDKLTLNYGGRFDHMDQYVSASQFSPRVGIVYEATPATTLHAGYARYFTPPAFELVTNDTVSAFAGTTNQSALTLNDMVKPERDHYFDVGASHRVNDALTLGLDAYYKKASNLLDEGQFGSALIYTPFNYAQGRVYGLEFSSTYRENNLSGYLNVAYSRAQGKTISSGQFNFDPDELQYISSHWVNLDHDQRITASLGGAYKWGANTFMASAILGTGLRAGFANSEHLPFYAQVNLGVARHFETAFMGKFDARIMLVNALNRVYQLRDGSGIGVGASQYGPHRAVYVGLTKYFQ